MRRYGSGRKAQGRPLWGLWQYGQYWGFLWYCTGYVLRRYPEGNLCHIAGYPGQYVIHSIYSIRPCWLFMSPVICPHRRHRAWFCCSGFSDFFLSPLPLPYRYFACVWLDIAWGTLNVNRHARANPPQKLGLDESAPSTKSRVC